MTNWYSAKELAGLPDVPGTDRGVRDQAVRESWESKPNPARGGGRLYALSSLPAETQAVLVRQQAKAVVAAEAERLPVRQEVQLGMFETQQQALTADARQGVLKAIENLMQTTGYTQTRCAQLLIDMARGGQTEPYMVMMLKSARDGRGRRSADGLPSARSLLRFIQQGKAGELVPQYRQKDLSVPDWAEPFLSYYATPEKRSVQHSYEMFARDYSGELPSIHQVRRFIGKMGSVSRNQGRMGPIALLAEKGKVERDVSNMRPTSVYSADGHTFDAEIQHPAHGQPFRPEITSIIDVKTRKLVGWSIGLAENAMAVLDALRCASVNHGIPAIFYVDNGPGYKNAMMSDEAIGLMGRLACHLTHSIPYRSQSRGVVERPHRSIWVSAAKELPGYIGKDMDRQAAQKMHKITRKAIKDAGKTIRMPLLGWDAFMEFCKAKVDEYNNRPHSGLPKFIDADGKRRHLSPNECWQLHVDEGFTAIKVTDDEARPLFRPQVIRKLVRCEIDLFSNSYYAPQLEEHNREKVRVAFDIHDVERIWIYNSDGVYLGTGELNGNKKDFFPKSFVEQKEEERLAGQEKRLHAKLDRARAERYGTTAIAHEEIELAGLGVLNMNQLRARVSEMEPVIEADFEPVIDNVTPISAANPTDTPVPKLPAERWALWNALNDQPDELASQCERIGHWFMTYQKSNEFKAFARRDGAAVASL